MLNDPHYSVKKYWANSKEVFPTVEIKGGVTITYYDHLHSGQPIGLFTFDETLSSIINQVQQGSKYESMMNIVLSRTAYRLTEKMHMDHPKAIEQLSKGHPFDMSTNIFERIPQVFFEIEPEDGHKYIKILGRIQNERVIRHIRKDYVNVPDNLYKYKVFMPSGTGTGAFGEKLAKPVIAEPAAGATETFISIGMCETNSEAEAIAKYIQTKFVRTLLGVLKTTQHLTPEVWRYVPLQDFSNKSDIDWSKTIHQIDLQLYEKYGLTEKEVDFIETYVKPMDGTGYYEKSLKLAYNDIIQNLLNKYGPAKHNYFKDTNCTEKNHKVSRTDEGLYCHHIDEDKAILLSNDMFAANNPFDYQKANRLVYCNLLEHLLLHVKIAENPSKKANKNELPGIGGAIAFLCKELNDIYAGKEPEEEWRKKIVEKVKDNFNDYITVLRYLWNVVENNPLYKSIITKEMLCVGYDGKIVPKVLKALNGEETEE